MTQAPEPASPEGGLAGSLTLSFTQPDGAGRWLFFEMAAAGDFSDAHFDRRFYLVDLPPPPGLPAADFWATILSDIAGFLRTEPEPGG